MALNPLTIKRWRRFTAIRRGYVSFLMLTTLLGLTLVLELFINSRALEVRYEGQWHFPTYTAMHSGQDFGLDYAWEANYRDLKTRFDAEGKGNFVILALVPFNPLENDLKDDGTYPPFPPSMQSRHL